MGRINENKPEAILRLSVLDVDLIQRLATYWLVTVEQGRGEIIYELYPKKK